MGLPYQNIIYISCILRDLCIAHFKFLDCNIHKNPSSCNFLHSIYIFTVGIQHASSEVFTAVKIVATQFRVVVGYQRFRGPRYLHLQGHFTLKCEGWGDPEYDILPQHYTASQPRRPQPGFKMLYVALCTQQLSVTVKISTLVREVLVLIIHQVNGYFNRRLRHSPQAFQTNAGLIPWKTPQPPPSRSIRSNNSWALSHSTLYNLPQLKQLN